MMSKLSVAEAKKRITENRVYMNQVIKTNFKKLDLTKLHTYENRAGERTALALAPKIFDILVASLCNGLAYADRNTGADGVVLKNGKLVDSEFKSTFVTPKFLSFGPRGGIGYKKKNFAYAAGASWHINSATHLQTKKVDTYFGVFDDQNGRILDLLVIPKNKILNYLVHTGGKTNYLHIIPWSKFKEWGIPVSKNQPFIGYDAFIEEQRNLIN